MAKSRVNVLARYTTLVVLVAVFALFPFGALAAEKPSPQGFQIPPVEDFSGLAWTDAFDRLHEKFSREYGFTDWKNIDWPALYKEFKPRIEQAQAANDFTAYYLTLKEYIHRLPDGHVRMNALSDIDNRYIGGGYGFAATRLSDGRIIASWVDESSPAFAQGLRPGAELIAWNGRPVNAAVQDVAAIFSYNSATAEDLANQKVRYLTRAPVNAELSLTFALNGEPAWATLTAYDDQGLSLAKTYPATVVSDGFRDLLLNADKPQPPPESMVETKILDGNIGYIKLWGELDVDLKGAGKAPSTLGLFRAALDKFNRAKVTGLIIDIRNNVGGLDSMVADMLGSFYRESVLYEYQSGYNTVSRTFELFPYDDQGNLLTQPGLYIKPAHPYFRGPVVALINSKCVSSGEGLAMGIRNLPNGATVGFYGTNGSFGLAGDGAKLPGNIEVHWPFGQSQDKLRQAQIDSRGGVGGVAPTIRTPMTLENALRVARGEDVELEQAIEVIKHFPR